ncbi:hypothetical protein [Arenimonas fontis]|uniref:EF-hand domain-containing protein n=1 Tax=Arenimonas fontis TaxID=2608255 RepID=A0A5B2ZC90_9GAMM|nr:hypothetical protein [Arenimonas fontis]KAA2286298.1 hypothetical protein F0415_02030 [Arenimonas fontis]
MFRTALILVSLVPTAALAMDCPGVPAASIPASVPAQEMTAPAATPAADCAPRDAATWQERQRRPAQPAAPAPIGPQAPAGAGAYVPKTAHDNTPWRFDMNQNGRRMTAEEFDAWMKAKGIRVATGRPAALSPAPAAGTAAAQAGE